MNWRLIRIFLLSGTVLFFTSCAYFDERIAAMQACAGDKACLDSVSNAGKAGKAVGDATGIPWAGAAAGGLAALITLFFARRKKNDQA